MPESALFVEARRRKSAPVFGLLTRAAAEALVRDQAAPLAEAIARSEATSEEVLFMARVQGVSGLLARLSELSPGALGEPLHEALALERARIGARGARLAEDLAELGRRAARAGLPFVPLKGAVLAPLRFRDLSLRPAADLDLLAPGDTSEGWRHVLEDAGYRQTGRTFKHLTFGKEGARAPDGFGEDPDNPRPVDLHSVIREPLLGRVVDVTEAYRSRLKSAELHGAPALLPDDDGLLLHLLLHAAPHAIGRGARLVQLADLRLLAPSPEGARLVVEELGEIGWGTSHLAARELPGSLPAAFLEKLAPAAPSRLRRERWLARPGLLTGEEEKTLLVLAELPLCATPRDALRRLAAVLPERALLADLSGAGTPYPRALARYVRDRLS